MKLLESTTKFMVIFSLVSVLGSVGVLFFIKNTKNGRAFTVRRELTQIFQKYGHPVVWEGTSDYAVLVPYLRKEVERWALTTHGWQVPTEDYSKSTARYFTAQTLVHVLTVDKVIPNGSTLIIFILENVKPSWVEKTNAILPSHDITKVPTTHRHYSLDYTLIYVVGMWGDLTEFPLEHFFPFPEVSVSERHAWVTRAQRKVCFFGAGFSALCLLLRYSILGRYHPHITFGRICALVEKFRRNPRPSHPREALTDNTEGARDTQTRKDLWGRDNLVLLSSIQDIAARALQKERDKAEQTALRMEIERLFAAADPDRRLKIERIIAQFPGANRIRLNKARELLRQTQMLCTENTTSGSDHIQKSQPAIETQPDNASTTDVDRDSMRQFHSLLADIDKYISEEEVDPFVTKCIILWGFMRPTANVPFVAGSYGPQQTILGNIEAKFSTIEETFGRRLSPEEMREHFKLLENRGVIVLKSGHGNSYSLNDRENSVSPPWHQVIAIINHARWRLVSLRSGGNR